MQSLGAPSAKISQSRWTRSTADKFEGGGRAGKRGEVDMPPNAKESQRGAEEDAAKAMFDGNFYCIPKGILHSFFGAHYPSF